MPALLSAVLVGFACVAHGGSGAERAAHDSDGEELLQLFPNTIEEHVSKHSLTVVAFVNPALPLSESLHPVLHDLRLDFANDSRSVSIAFVDCGSHRAFIKKYAIRALPTLLMFFPLLGARHPIPLAYNSSTTAQEYKLEIIKFASAGDAFEGISASTKLATQAAISAQYRKELRASGPAGMDVAAASGEASGVGSGMAASSSSNADTASAFATAALQLMRAELRHTQEMAALASHKLAVAEEALRTLLTQGTAGVTRRLNERLAALLAQHAAHVEHAAPPPAAEGTAGAHQLTAFSSTLAAPLAEVHVLRALMQALL